MELIIPMNKKNSRIDDISTPRMEANKYLKKLFIDDIY